MGQVFRLTDDIEKWLKTFDLNPHKALKIVKDNYVPYKELIAKLDDISTKIDDLKRY